LKKGARAFADQSFEDLRAQCLDEGVLFTDPEFPPSNQSLYVRLSFILGIKNVGMTIWAIFPHSHSAF